MKYLIALSLILTVSSASTQETMPQPNDMKTFITKQPCAPVVDMLRTPYKYGERILFTGEGVQFSAGDGRPYNGGAFFFVNQDTGTWTLVSVYGDGIACLVANGKDFEPYTGGQPYDRKDNL
tara:strand:+ start:441 stop:806 length:366 start_codon:yes stop_codon:yes gene_type:complete